MFKMHQNSQMADDEQISSSPHFHQWIHCLHSNKSSAQIKQRWFLWSLHEKDWTDTSLLGVVSRDLATECKMKRGVINQRFSPALCPFSKKYCQKTLIRKFDSTNARACCFALLCFFRHLMQAKESRGDFSQSGLFRNCNKSHTALR